MHICDNFIITVRQLVLIDRTTCTPPLLTDIEIGGKEKRYSYQERWQLLKSTSVAFVKYESATVGLFVCQIRLKERIGLEAARGWPVQR